MKTILLVEDNPALSGALPVEGFVKKPIDMEKLVAEVVRHCGGGSATV